MTHHHRTGVPDAMERAGWITQDSAGARLKTALKLQIGSGRPRSVDMVEQETGIPARTVRSYLDGENQPSLVNLLKLFAVLPPEFADAMLELAGLGGVRVTSADPPDPKHLLHAMAHRLEKLAGAMTNGSIDHQQRRALIAPLRSLGAEMEAFVAGLEAMD